MLKLSNLSREKLIAIAELKKRGVDITPFLEPEKPVITDPVEWIETNFLIPEGDGRLHLDGDYRSRCLCEILATDSEGNFKYSTVLWGDIKKSAKSTIAGAVAAWFCNRQEWASVKVVANDLKQADSREAYYLRRAIQLNPEWAATTTQRGYTIEWSNGSRIEAIPVDPKGEAGGNDDLVIFTELWAAKHQAAQQMWTELTLSPTKFGKSMRWVETYAGFVGESPLLERLYKQGVVEGRKLWDDLPVWVNDSARLFCLWNEEPRLSWQTEEYYNQEAATLIPEEFDRVHRNRWGQSTSAFVSAQWWQDCKVDALPEMRPNEKMVIGVDAAVSGDCFAIVGVSRMADKRFAIRFVEVIYPPKGGKIDFDIPKQILIDQKPKTWEFVYDPYQLHSMATDLYKKGYNINPFEQGAKRLVGDKLLHDLIRNQQIVYDNTYPELSKHILAANKKEEGDQKLRIVKRGDGSHIDAAVACAMACLTLSEY